MTTKLMSHSEGWKYAGKSELHSILKRYLAVPPAIKMVLGKDHQAQSDLKNKLNKMSEVQQTEIQT